MLYWIVFLLLSYITGALPTSYLAGKSIKGIDLREYGSGNLGATNVYRVLGLIPALAVLFIDIFKGFAPVFFFDSVLNSQLEISEVNLTLFRVFCGVFAILGHIFSPFIGFKGGKGVATAAGVTLALTPAALGLSFLLWVILFASSRIVSVASLAAALFLPLFIYLIHRSLDGSAILQSFGILITLVVFWTHRSNIGRLVQGKEKRLSKGGNSK